MVPGGVGQVAAEASGDAADIEAAEARASAAARAAAPIRCGKHAVMRRSAEASYNRDDQIVSGCQ